MHAYLLYTFCQAPRLLRKYRLITGYRGVKLGLVAYVFYLGHLIYPCVLYPSLRFRISTSDYECTEHDKDTIAKLITWTHLASPLCYQLPFFGLLVQLSTITQQNQAQLANADTSINHELDEGLYPIVYLSSPQFMSFVSRDTLIACVVKYKRRFTD